MGTVLASITTVLVCFGAVLTCIGTVLACLTTFFAGIGAVLACIAKNFVLSRIEEGKKRIDTFHVQIFFDTKKSLDVV